MRLLGDSGLLLLFAPNEFDLNSFALAGSVYSTLIRQLITIPRSTLWALVARLCPSLAHLRINS